MNRQNQNREHIFVAAVIPCYRVASKIKNVIRAIPPEIDHIICVDDACPEKSGVLIQRDTDDPRVAVLFHHQNQGVGGACITGYRHAEALGAEIIVKIDGDGQMDPALIPLFVEPIASGLADYTKGNRFFSPETVSGMPPVRLAGNAVLSFMTKISTGYWSTFDPTNGFTAIHVNVLRALPLDKLSRRFFFESDLLFRLGLLRAVVLDIPMRSVYFDEESNLRISRVLVPFLRGHMRNFLKRLLYRYYLHDFSLASLEFLAALPLLAFSFVFGVSTWMAHAMAGIETPSGTVMLAALPAIVGFQLLLSCVNFDVSNVPKSPIHRRLSRPSFRPTSDIFQPEDM